MKNICNKFFMITAVLCLSFLLTNNTFATTTVDSLKYRKSNIEIPFNDEWDVYESFDVLADITEDETQSSISTTYYMSGYGSFFKVGDNVSMAKFADDTILDGVKLNISAANNGSRQVVATYVVTNTSDTTKSFSLASFADIDIRSEQEYWEGGWQNDAAAIIKRNNHVGFIITQDEQMIPGYGLSYEITLNPRGTTTWIGNYWGDDGHYFGNRFTNGTVDAITASDAIDTALSYSWSDTLQAGQSKTYTAIFSADVYDIETVDFYAFNDFDNVLSTRNAVINGALTMPATTGPLTKGYNYKWNSKKDGTGTAINGGETVIFDGTVTEYYEYRYKNGVVVPDGDDDEYSTKIVLDEDIVSEYNNEAEESYGDITIEPTIAMETNPDVMKNMVGEEAYNAVELAENEESVSTLQLALRKNTINEEGEENSEDIYESVDISLTLPEDLTDEYGDFRIMHYDYITGKFVAIESDYDMSTGRISFNCSPDDTYLIIGAYISVPDTGAMPQDAEGSSFDMLLSVTTIIAAIFISRRVVVCRSRE